MRAPVSKYVSYENIYSLRVFWLLYETDYWKKIDAR